MNCKISVTVVIPAYCAAKTIGRAVESVLRQTRRPEEILVIDDGSPDDLPSALAAYRREVTLLRKPNGGAGSARNMGIDRAQGNLIAFLDADDYWEPEKLERQVDVFHHHPEVGLVATWFFTKVPGHPRCEPSLARAELWDRVIFSAREAILDLAARVVTSTVMVRRDLLDNERFDSSLKSAQDRDLWVRLIASTSVYLLSEPLATYVLEPNSISRTCVDQDCSCMLRVVRRYSGLLGRRGLRRWEAHVFRRWAGGHLDQGRAREAMGPAYHRLCLEPFSPEAWWILLKSACRSALGSRRRERRVAVEHPQQEAPPLQQVRDA